MDPANHTHEASSEIGWQEFLYSYSIFYLSSFSCCIMDYGELVCNDVLRILLFVNPLCKKLKTNYCLHKNSGLQTRNGECDCRYSIHYII